MTMDTITAQLLRRVNAGEAIVDLGQLTPATKRRLDHMTQRGQLRKLTYHGFPLPKWAWIGAGLPEREWPEHVWC